MAGRDDSDRGYGRPRPDDRGSRAGGRDDYDRPPRDADRFERRRDEPEPRRRDDREEYPERRRRDDDDYYHQRRRDDYYPDRRRDPRDDHQERRRDDYYERAPARRPAYDDEEDDRRPPPRRREYDDAPPRSQGGEDRRRPPQGGWDDERRPARDDDRRPPPRDERRPPQGGWDDDRQPPRQAPPKSGGQASSGWGDSDNKPAPKSSNSGWGAEQQESSGGWGDSKPAAKSSGGWGNDSNNDDGWGSSNKPAAKSNDGWGEQESSSGWGDSKPAAKPAAKSSGGWGNDSNNDDGGWGGSSNKKSGGDDWGSSNKDDGGWGGSSNKSGGDEWGSGGAGDGGDAWGGSKGGGGGSGCRKCGEEGHFARECPNAGKGGGGGSGCRKCGEEGHFARECPNAGKSDGGDAWGGGEKSGGGGCHKCGQEGHFARECPNPDSGVRQLRPDNPDDHCWRCDGMGHTAQTCPSRIECGNEPGKAQHSRHNQLYQNDFDENAQFDDDGFGAEDTERADELFGTHSNTGIQFDKYSQIEVQVYGVEVPEPLKNFSDLDLGAVLSGNLKLAQWDVPTPIQRYALPIAFAGRDIMGCAQTGSGKTAAFLFPIIRKLLKRRNKHIDGEPPQPQALIVVPVRELAQQIHIEAIKFTYRSPIRSVVCYGGSGSRDQRDALRKGCDILIGTPGRLIDFMLRKEFDLSKIKFLCFDEADRMLDTGFGDDMKQLIEQCPPMEERQTLMFSATFPDDVQELAKAALRPDHIVITVGRVGAATPTVKQVVTKAEDYEKFDALVELLHNNPVKTLIFVGKKITAEELKSKLGDLGVPIETIHGDKDQYRREEALESFKKGRTKVLIATDVAARGLDIPQVGHVINYDLPNNIDDYVHRIGRTGRVGHEGLATSFYNSGSSYIAAELTRTLEEQGFEISEWLREAADSNPAGPRKVFAAKPKNYGSFAGGSGGSNAGGSGGDAWGGGGDSWGGDSNKGSGGGGDSWGNSGGGDDGWGSSAQKSGGGDDDGWGSSSKKSGGDDDGWGAPAKSSGGGGGWGEDAPAQESSGGGWGEEAAPAKSGGDDGWGGSSDAAPAQESSGGWGDDSAKKESSNGGGWGEEAAPAQESSGGWGAEESAPSGGGDGW